MTSPDLRQGGAVAAAFESQVSRVGWIFQLTSMLGESNESRYVMTSADTAGAAPRACFIAAGLEVLGERWALLALREMSLGVHRFDQIARNTGASRDIL